MADIKREPAPVAPVAPAIGALAHKLLVLHRGDSAVADLIEESALGLNRHLCALIADYASLRWRPPDDNPTAESSD